MLDQLDKRAVALIATAVQRDLSRRDRDKRFLAEREAEVNRNLVTARATLAERYRREALAEIAGKRLRVETRPAAANIEATWFVPRDSIFDSLRPAYSIPWLEPAAETPESAAAVVPAQIVDLPVEAPAAIEETAPPKFGIGVDHDAMGRLTRIRASQIGGPQQFSFTVQRNDLGMIAALATQDTQDAAPPLEFRIQRDDLRRPRYVEVGNRRFAVRRDELGAVVGVEEK